MRIASVLVLVLGCGGGDAKNPNDVKPQSGGAAAITQFAKRDDALKADMIGGSDGSLKPDGRPDAAFDMTFRGPVVSLAVISVNDNAYQWDTYVGIQTVPAEMQTLVPKGNQTGGIGVFEAGKPLNNLDGSFAITDDKERHVIVYISDNGAFQPGAAFKVVAATPERKIIEGPVAKF